MKDILAPDQQFLRLDEFKLFSDLVPIGMYRTNNRGECLHVNKFFCQITGMSYEDVKGYVWLSQIHKDDVEGMYQDWRYAVENHEKFYYQFRFDTNGEVLHGLTEASPFFNQEGEFQGHIGIYTDVTHLYQAQEELHDHHTLLASSARNTTAGELVSAIAHELNQPLAAITNYASAALEMLHNDNASQRATHIVERIAKQGERAGSIVHRLKEFVRKGRLTKTQCGLNKLIRTAISLAENKIKQVNVELDLKLLKDDIDILADEIQLEQVLLNIINNAVEAVEELPECSRKIGIISYHLDVNRCAISINNNGPTIDSNDANQIFDPFFTTKSEGMGMGLAIAHSIIKAHNGDLFVRNLSPEGVEFVIHLPK